MAHVSRIPSGNIEVSYPMREAQHVITRAEYELVLALENKVRAIKFIKDQYGLGLYEAKQIVDTINSYHGGL